LSQRSPALLAPVAAAQRQSAVSAFARSRATNKLFAFAAFSSAFLKLRRDKRGKRNPFSSVLIRGLNSLRPQRLCVEKISAAPYRAWLVLLT